MDFNILDAIKNFLQFINDNWTVILIILGLIVGIIKKVKDFMGKSEEEQIEIAKKQIKEAILKMITDAEMDYAEWKEAGAIKRSQVIKEIFEEFPILEKVADQEALIAWIDEMIDEALETLRDVIETNSETAEEQPKEEPKEEMPEEDKVTEAEV